MSDNGYTQRRSEIETYFDRTAADAWARLTSNAPVSRIRQTVRAGRDEMRKPAAQLAARRTCRASACWTPAAVPERSPWKPRSAAQRWWPWTCRRR
jgi:hypothetical protein